MGKNPRRLDGLGGDERFAALALERVTGGVATAHDVGPLQGAHDLDLALPRGRRAAVEVTTISGPGTRHQAPLLGGTGPSATTAAAPVPNHDHVVARLLPAAVTELLLAPHVARRAAKVTSVTGVDERHLFVGIGRGWLPDGLHDALGSADVALPTTDPDEVPERLTHVWLVVETPGAPLVGWQRSGGWSSHNLSR